MRQQRSKQKNDYRSEKENKEKRGRREKQEHCEIQKALRRVYDIIHSVFCIPVH
jgi:hypothetical protein